MQHPLSMRDFSEYCEAVARLFDHVPPGAITVTTAAGGNSKSIIWAQDRAAAFARADTLESRARDIRESVANLEAAGRA